MNRTLKKDSRIVADQEAFEVCARWQKKLNLMDWEVEFVLVSRGKFTNKTDLGNVTYRLYHKRARIQLLPQSLRNKGDQPFEHTVVHELLHLIFAPFTDAFVVGSIPQSLEEQAINAISSALSGHSFRELD